MIPILSYAYPVTGNGLGGLSDAISCVVTNEINGEYELRMRYPITGEHYAEMLINYIIMATPGTLANAEPFRIYRITRPLNGVVTVYARHLSYDMSGIVIEPCTASSLTQAMTTIPANAVPSCPFTLASTRTVASSITVKEPKTLWSLLGGSAGSFLDVYGGEWEFTGYTANLKTQLGTNRGVEIRYGKNLTQLDVDADISSTYGGVYPFWYSDEDGLATMTGGYVSIPGSIYSRILLLDCSDDFDTKPTSAQLQARAEAYITANSVGSPKDSWKVSFALLAQSKEYETQAILEQVVLGDTVKIKYEALGVDASARVVKTEWDVLGDKYESITLGRVKQNLASILVGQNRETERAIASTKSALEQAIAHSTDFIKNGTGVMRSIYNSSGDLMEIVSLDNADITQAVSVWRWNNGGFGHSSTGYNGQYTTAITQNGAIVADFITTGTLNAARVKAGILSDAANKNSWNLDTGALTITDGSISVTYTQDYTYSDYIQTDLDRIDDIRNGVITPTESDFEKYDITGDGVISAQDRMYIVKMMNTSTNLTKTIATVIDPKANAKTIQISLNVGPDMGGSTPAINKTYYFGGTRSKVGYFEANTVHAGSAFHMGTNNVVQLSWDFGLQLYDLSTLKLKAQYDPTQVILSDGTYNRVLLDNTGLTFRDSSDNVTAQYPSDGLYYLELTTTSQLTDANVSALLNSNAASFKTLTPTFVRINGSNGQKSLLLAYLTSSSYGRAVALGYYNQTAVFYLMNGTWAAESIGKTVGYAWSKVVGTTITVTSGATTYIDADITATSKIFIQGYYSSTRPTLGYSFTAQPSAGQTNIYVRQGSSIPADNTSFNIWMLIVK